MARTTKLSSDVTAKIVEALRTGNARRTAARYAGIAESRFYDWMKRGEQEEKGQFREFRETVLKTEAECEVRNISIIQKAAFGYNTKTTRTKTTSYVRTVLGPDKKPLTGKDGNPIQEVVTETETVTTTGHEFDWRASLEWAKRRNRLEWGDSIDINKLPTEQLLELLLITASHEAAETEDRNGLGQEGGGSSDSGS